MDLPKLVGSERASLNFVFVLIAANIAMLSGLAVIATPYMAIATTAYSAMVWGVFFRREKRLHVALMHLAILLDISLVGLLELQRSAIATAVSFSLNPLQQGHIAASTLALVLYFPILGLGWALYRGRRPEPGFRALHIRIGYAAFALRTIGFILMFAMLEHVTKAR